MSAPLPLIPAITAACCLLLFTAIAGVDGIHFHIRRYKLYQRPASRYEHRLHTINAILFVPLILLLFCAAPHGLLLWLVVALFVGSLAIEVVDVLCEPKSRRDLGGLTGAEYLMHFLMAGLRFGAILPLLLIPAPSDWLPSHTAIEPRPLWLLLGGLYIALPAVAIATWHILLDRRGAAMQAAGRGD